MSFFQLELPGPERFQSWNTYISVSSIFLTGVLSTFFGALSPLIDWLTFQRAVYWLVAAILVAAMIAAAALLSFRSNGIRHQSYLNKVLLFGVMWAVFPFALCSGVYLLGDPTVTCACEKLPPETKVGLRKVGSEIVLDDPKPLRELIQRTKSYRTALPVFVHVTEVSRIIERVKKNDKDKASIDFITFWERSEREARTGLVRLVADFTGYPLAPSELSDEFRRQISLEISRSQNSMVLLTGDQVLQALQAMIEAATTFEPLVDDAIVAAAEKYIRLSILQLYEQLKELPVQYVADLDPDFKKVLHSIPRRFEEKVRQVGYANSIGELLAFECGVRPNQVMRSGYSRFFVPQLKIARREVLDKMQRGPWPIGTPSTYFSEDWWLENAVWQMLAREHGSARNRLFLRIDQFNNCGPP